MSYHDIEVASARRFPDPVGKTTPPVDHHSFIVNCQKLPENISNDPNARSTNLRKRTYKNVQSSLLGEQLQDVGMFHLKNKGIVIVADKVEKLKDDKYRIHLSEGQGILDGGHTYQLIQENKTDIPEEQFIRVDVRSNIPLDWIPCMAGGLNTSVQVQDVSLENLAGKFEWLKDAVNTFSSHIAWDENEDDKSIDARDLIAIMYLFNIHTFPNDAKTMPITAYNSKQAALKHYQEQQQTYQNMNNIVSQILELHDYIASTAVEVWNSVAESTRGRRLEIIDRKTRGEFNFPFCNSPSSDAKLTKAALYPILSSFRWFLKQDHDTKLVSWVCDFEKVKSFWAEDGRELMEISYDTSRDLNYNLTAVGKNTNYWKTLHATVGMRLHSKGVIGT